MAESREHDKAGRPNTLRLTKRHLDDLLDILDAKEGEPRIQRNYARWPFRLQTINLKIRHPGGTETELIVAARNLSAQGMSLLHSSFVYPGSKCSIDLPRPRCGTICIQAKIAWCSHVRGVLHELGVVFDEIINVREFIERDELDECFSIEKVDPAKLEGRLLLVSQSELDHRIIKHFLRETCLRVSTAETAEEALTIAREGCDVILAELDGDDISGAELIPMLRNAGVQTPAILMSSDTSPRARLLYRNAQADAFLTKPLSDETLMRGLAEFLVLGNDRDTPGVPIEGASDLARSLAGEFTKQAERLEEAMTADNPRQCLTLALELKGTAPCLGFDKIGKAASAAAEDLISTESIEQSKLALDDLVMTCRRAQVSSAA